MKAASSLVRLAPLLLAILFAGCGAGGGGGGGNALPPPSGTPPPPPTTFPSPPPISVTFLQQVHPVVLPPASPPAALSPAILGFLESLQTMMARRGSTVGANDKEIVGTFISGGGPYIGITNIASAYSAATLALPLPGAAGTNQLFAPFIMPPDHGCLVTASYYYNDGSGPKSAFVVSDLCSITVFGPITALFTPMDANFLASYVRNDANGVPSYESVSFTPQSPSDASTWYVVLYNFATGQWDLATSAGGNRPRTEGGSYFASAFLPGACPALPVLSSHNVALATSTGGYELVTPTTTATSSRILGTTGFADVVDSCFLADQTGPPSYNFNVITPNSAWTVTPH